MADTKISGFPELTTPASDDLLVIVDDPSGGPLNKKITVANLVGSSTATLTNKTIDADGTGNSITNIDNGNIKSAAAIALNKLAALTPSEIVITDSSGFLDSADVATYPSLTELAYMKGVTSAIQTQINAKGAGDMLAATYDPGNVADDAFAMDNMVEGTVTKIMTGDERTKLSGIETGADVTDATNVAAAGAHMSGGTDVPITDGGTGQSTAQAAIDALTQVSGATAEHVLTKDTVTGNAVWKASTGSGDMLAATYDPGNVAGDAFDMDNMVEGATTKIMTEDERTKLTGIEAGADITDATNVDAAGAVMESDTSFNNLTTATALPWTGMKPGVDGEIPTFDSSGNPAFVAVGTAGQVLTSNGAGAAPTFQDAVGGSSTFWTDDGETTAYASATTFTISGQDETAKFFAGRGLKLTQAGVNSGNPYYGFVVSSTFSTNTTVTIFAEFDIGNEALTVALTNERIGVIQYADTLTVVADTSNPLGRVYTREGGTVLGARYQVQTAPTGSASTCDVHIGGTSDFTTASNPSIAATGTDSGYDRGDLTVFLGGVEIEIFVDTVGSTIAGGAPNIELFYIPTAWKNLT